MDISAVIGVSAGILQLIGFAIYNRQIFKGTSIPNASTWALWSFLTILAASSYVAITSDFAKYALTLAGAFANIATFLYALLAGKFRRIDRFDTVILFAGILAALSWYFYQSAYFANLIITVTITLSLIPVFRTVAKKPDTERSLPWLVWAIAYALNTLAVVLRGPDFWSLLYPVMGFINHGAVALLCTRRKS